MKNKNNIFSFASCSLNVCLGFLFIFGFHFLIMEDELSSRIVLGIIVCSLPAIMVSIHMFFKQESTKEELCEYEEELKRQVDNHVRLEILTATISRQVEKNELTLTRMEENIMDLHELCGEMKESANFYFRRS